MVSNENHQTSTAIDSAQQMEIDSSKFNYLFGQIANHAHNVARSQQLALQMKALGISNNLAGRTLLTETFERMIPTSDNISHTFTKGTQNFEVRETLFAGPSGKFSKFEATFEVMPDGARRFVTLIIKE